MEDNNLNNEELSNIVNEDNNVDINEQNNNIEQNNENINYIKQNNSSSVPIIIMFIILLLFVFVFLGNNSNLFSNSNKQEQNNELIDDSQKDDNIDTNKNNNNNNVDTNNNIQQSENENNDNIESDEVKRIRGYVYDFPYSKVLNTEYAYDELWYTYVTKEVFSNISSTGITIYSQEDEMIKYEEALNKKDSNGNTYPKYQFGSLEHVYMLLGLTVDEISKKELDLELFCGGCNIKVIDGIEFKKEVEKLFGNTYNMFNKSFELEGYILEENFDIGTYYYDKGLNKVLKVKKGGGTGILPFTKVEILNEKVENDEYIIQFVEGYFQFDLKNKKVNLKNNEKSTEIIDKYSNLYEYDIDENFEIEYKNILVKNQNKLNKYEVVFEKSNNGYSYKTIRSI